MPDRPSRAAHLLRWCSALTLLGLATASAPAAAASLSPQAMAATQGWTYAYTGSPTYYPEQQPDGSYHDTQESGTGHFNLYAADDAAEFLKAQGVSRWSTPPNGNDARAAFSDADSTVTLVNDATEHDAFTVFRLTVQDSDTLTGRFATCGPPAFREPDPAGPTYPQINYLEGDIRLVRGSNATPASPALTDPDYGVLGRIGGESPLCDQARGIARLWPNGAPTTTTQAETRRLTAIAVRCDGGATAGSGYTCTASVGDVDARAGASTPTGIVAWSTTQGTLTPDHCTLAADATQPSLASCQIAYANAAAQPGTDLPVTAVYEGSSVHQPVRGMHHLSTDGAGAGGSGGGAPASGDASAPSTDPTTTATVPGDDDGTLSLTGQTAEGYGDQAAICDGAQSDAAAGRATFRAALTRPVAQAALNANHTADYRPTDTVGDAMMKTVVKGGRGLAYCATGALYGAGKVLEAGGSETAQGIVLAAGAAGSVATANPAPFGISGAVALVQYPVRYTGEAISLVTGRVLDDPPRKDFRTIARPRRAHVGAIRGVPAAVTRLAADERDLIAFSTAAATSIDRAGGARKAHDARWLARQQHAVVVALTRVRAVDAEIPTLLPAATAFVATRPRVTAAQLAQAKRVVRGTPTPTLRAYSRATGASLAQIRRAVAHATPAAIAATPDPLTTPYLPGLLAFQHATVTGFMRMLE